MTNQTIDGVPRELLERLLIAVTQDFATIGEVRELRALLDAPIVQRKPFGWFRTPKDCPLQGMFLHYDPEHGERDIQNALDFGFTVKRLYDTPAAQPQGEPVAELQVAFFEHGPKATINWFTPSAFEPGATKLYTKQPAPVALTQEAIDRIVPSLNPEPDRGEFHCEWALWSDRERIRNKLSALLTANPAPVAVVRCSFCDVTDQDGNPWSGGSATQDGILIYRVIGCKDHKHLADACLAEVARLNTSL